tara:strand:+ start:713 stop:1693 length:981 start_codon:yes stop_codon:yes gene_type:complete
VLKLSGGVEFYKINEQNLIMTDAAQTITFGDNIPSGRTVESVILHFNQTTPATFCLGGFDNLISNYRCILNGTVFTDFRTSVNDPTNIGLGRFGYFLQSLGNNAVSVEVPSETAKDYWAEIPMGANVERGVGRMEFVIGLAAATISATAGTLEVWLRLNDDTQTTTTVVPATSFTSAIGISQVVVRVPQNVQGSVAGILMQNQTEAADNIGTQGIRVHLLGAFGLEPSLLRYLNSDLSNGLMYADAAGDDQSQTYETGVEGAIFIPTYNAVGGDLVMEVDFTANAQSYTFQPIMTSSLNGKQGATTRSTQSSPSNTSKSILARTLE